MQHLFTLEKRKILHNQEISEAIGLNKYNVNYQLLHEAITIKTLYSLPLATKKKKKQSKATDLSRFLAKTLRVN